MLVPDAGVQKAASDDPSQGTPAAFYSAAALLFGLFVLRTAWVSDDGFIAVRSWDNFVHGHGLVLNWGQRVQGFTSPLHTLVGVPVFALVREPFLALIATSLVGLLGLFALTAWRWRAAPGRVGVFYLLLALSPSITQFATAGLENALGYCLATGFALACLRGVGPSLEGALWAGALVLCRHDFALLVVPTFLAQCLRAPRRSLRVWAVGFAPLLLWSLWALFYFGSPLPNTAYAKLNASVPRATALWQGVAYLVDLVQRDLPLSLTLLLGMGGVVRRRWLPMEARLLLTGALLYVGYTVAIGGDFMSGRFFTVPGVFVAATLVEEVPLPASQLPRLCFALGAALIPALTHFVPYVPGKWCGQSLNKITDERACYAPTNNLAENLVQPKWRTHGYLRDYKRAAEREQSQVVLFHLAGMAAYADTPRKHILETWSLTDPLLARLTHKVKPDKFRPGHFRRPIPAGYADSLRTGENSINDPCIHDLFDRVELATRAPLWAPGRLQAIWELNTTGGTCPAR